MTKRSLEFRSRNGINRCLAQILGVTFGFVVKTNSPPNPTAPASTAATVLVDLDSLGDREAEREAIRCVVEAPAGRPVAVISKKLGASRRRALARRGVMVYRSLDDGVFHDLAWKLGRKPSRTAA